MGMGGWIDGERIEKIDRKLGEERDRKNEMARDG